MPDWKKLRAGDRVRLLCVPAADIAQREQELRDGVEMAGWTADTVERVISSDPVVTIAYVDEYGAPWFERVLFAADGKPEHHSLDITDNDSWEYVDPFRNDAIEK